MSTHLMALTEINFLSHSKLYHLYPLSLMISHLYSTTMYVLDNENEKTYFAFFRHVAKFI